MKLKSTLVYASLAAGIASTVQASPDMTSAAARAEATDTLKFLETSNSLASARSVDAFTRDVTDIFKAQGMITHSPTGVADVIGSTLNQNRINFAAREAYRSCVANNFADLEGTYIPESRTPYSEGSIQYIGREIRQCAKGAGLETLSGDLPAEMETRLQKGMQDANLYSAKENLAKMGTETTKYSCPSIKYIASSIASQFAAGGASMTDYKDAMEAGLKNLLSHTEDKACGFTPSSAAHQSLFENNSSCTTRITNDSIGAGGSCSNSCTDSKAGPALPVSVRTPNFMKLGM